MFVFCCWILYAKVALVIASPLDDADCSAISVAPKRKIDEFQLAKALEVCLIIF